MSSRVSLIVSACAAMGAPVVAGPLVFLADSDFYSGTLDTASAEGTVNLYFSYTDPDGPNPSATIGALGIGFLEVAMGTETLLTGDAAGVHAMLSNGADENLFFGLYSSLGRDVEEIAESAFWFTASGLGMPDLAGATVLETRILLSSYQAVPLSAGGFNVTIGYGFRFYGVIPAPSAAAALSIGGLFAVRRRR